MPRRPRIHLDGVANHAVRPPLRALLLHRGGLLNALAYAQGTDIHVAPGQEHHLPHEAWHVVQQAQGRVRPTMQMKDGVPVNDDQRLEDEADVMGVKALQMYRADQNGGTLQTTGKGLARNVVQRQPEDDDVLKTQDEAKISARVEALLKTLEEGGEVPNHSARLEDLIKAVTNIRGEAREVIAGPSSLPGSAEASPSLSPRPGRTVSAAFNRTWNLAGKIAGWKLRIEIINERPTK